MQVSTTQISYYAVAMVVNEGSGRPQDEKPNIIRNADTVLRPSGLSTLPHTKVK